MLYVTVEVNNRSDPPTYICCIGKYYHNVSFLLIEFGTNCDSQTLYVNGLEKSPNVELPVIY